MHKLILTARRHSTTAASALLFGASLFTLGACSDDELAAPRASVKLPSVTITPGPVTLRAGGTQQYTALVKSPSGQEIPGAAVIWSTADQTVARVSSTGLVTVVGPGTAGIAARYENVQSIVGVTVLPAVAGVTLTTPQTSLIVGSSVQLSARALDGSGVPQPFEITYTSSAPAVYTVSSTGLATAVSAGTAIITAASEGRTATVTLTATPFVPVDRLTFTAGTGVLGSGATVQSTVATLAADGTNLGRPVTYTSSAPTIATVSATGLVSMIGQGSAVITATSEGKSATATVSSVIAAGTTYTLAGAAGQVWTYYVDVPAGATRLTVSTAGANPAQDVDIRVFAPGATAIACSSEGVDLNESCSVNGPLAAGQWRIRFESFTAFTATTLRAVITP